MQRGAPPSWAKQTGPQDHIFVIDCVGIRLFREQKECDQRYRHDADADQNV